MDDNKHRVDLNIYGRSSGIGRFMRQQLVVWIANRLDFGNGWKWTDSKSFPPATRLDFQSFTVCFAVRCDASCGRGGRGGGGICILCETFVHVGFFLILAFCPPGSYLFDVDRWAFFRSVHYPARKLGNPAATAAAATTTKEVCWGGGS